MLSLTCYFRFYKYCFLQCFTYFFFFVLAFNVAFPNYSERLCIQGYNYKKITEKK